MLERVQDILRRLQGGAKVDRANVTTVPADEGSKVSLEYVTDWNDLMQRRVDPDPQKKPFDEKKGQEEVRDLAHRIVTTGEAYGGSPIGVTQQDYRKWVALEQAFTEGIEPIQRIHAEQLEEVGRAGADNWLKVASTHVMTLGGEVVARRNIRERLALARKYIAESTMGPHLQLLEFCYGSMTSIRIGEVTFQDFLDPKDSSLVGRYRFLNQARLAVHRDLYDEILQDNMEPPKDAYPNMIRSTIWALPMRIQALLTLVPGAFEHAYKDARYPLNEIGMSAARLVKGVQETRLGIYRLLSNPRSEHFQALKQVLPGYLFDNDRPALFLVLTHLGLHNLENTRQLYRQSKKYIQTGVEEEFFSQLVQSIGDYAKELSIVASLPSEDDMDLIADLDEFIDPAKIPSFEQLGSIVSGIFQRASQTIYTVNPEGIDWPLSQARSVNSNSHYE